MSLPYVLCVLEEVISPREPTFPLQNERTGAGDYCMVLASSPAGLLRAAAVGGTVIQVAALLG